MPPQLQRTSWSLASLTPHPVTLSPSLLQSILPVFLTKALILLLVLQERLIRKVNCQFGGYISSGQSSPSQILTWAEFQRHIIKWVGSAALPCKRIGLAMASSDAEHIHVQKSEEEWRAVLSPEQFRILRQKGTELKGTGEYNKFYEDGLYKCAGCGTPLYKSTTKFDSGCGWPAFYEGLPGAINRNVDADGRRTEITCTACGGHLGHVFKGEGFQVPTDERHCVNSVSIKFIPAN